MKKPYCLDLDGGVYSLGDLNMMVYNKDTVDYPPADPQDPAKPFFTGAIRQEVTVGGETRPFLVYIPSRFPISGAGLFLYPEDGVSCGECLRSDCWQDLAEEFQVALVILESRKGGWSREDIQSEVSYSEAVFKKAISRVYFSLNEATYYIMGGAPGPTWPRPTGFSAPPCSPASWRTGTTAWPRSCWSSWGASAPTGTPCAPSWRS